MRFSKIRVEVLSDARLILDVMVCIYEQFLCCFPRLDTHIISYHTSLSTRTVTNDSR